MRPMLDKKSFVPFHWNPVPLRKSVRFKVLSIVLVLLFLLGVTTSCFSYWQELKKDNERINMNFALLADILENDISRWLTNRENDVIAMAANPLVQQYVSDISRESENYSQAIKKLEDYWREFQGQYGVYDEIYFATKDGKILASTNLERENTFRPRDDLIDMPLAKGKIYFQDAYMSPSTKKPSVAFSVPVTEPRTDDGVVSNYIGVLVFRVDIESVLQPLMESRFSLGSTGEVILINEYKTAITELRSQPGSALHYNLKSEPALRVVQGEEGIWRGVGYNNKEMISVYRYIPKVRWGIIVRQETAEVFGPLKMHMFRSLVVSIFFMISVIVVLYFLLNRILRPVTSMAEAAGKISQGDFTKRVEVKTRDEIGILGETLNYMTDELGQQFKLQKSRQEVLQTLVSTLEVNEMLDKGLNAVCKYFAFYVGAVFLIDSSREVMVRKVLYCPGQQLMEQRKELKIGEGLEGLAVTTQQIQVITDVPKDTSYTINWLGGDILPGSIVEVPLTFGTETLGVMSLASVNKKITEGELEVLSTIGTVMGVAVNNALSYERARELSCRLQELNEELTQQNEELNAQSEELQCQTEELQTQSEELQSITQELQIKNAELEKVGERKSNYLATLSHELRAPLNAVIGFSDVLLDRVVGELNGQQEKYLHEILNSGQHLLNLINDLLDLSKIEAGQVELKIQEIDPAVSLEEALAMVSAEVSRKQLEVTNLVTRNTYTVAADQDKLKQVFLNLLTNAVKFTPEGGRITIGARGNDKVLSLWVADTGIGIAKEYQVKIFEEFKQAGNTISGAFGGTGLGLAITRKLLNLQDGRIYVESEEGEGATFTFTLPIVSEEDYRLTEQLSCDIKCPEQGDCENCFCPRASVTYLQKPLDKTTLLGHVERVKCPLSNNPPTLLVVDDDPVVRSYAAAVLVPRGYKVISAEDGEQGINQALSKKLDGIILDIVMPGTDGFQVLDKISKHNWEKGLCVFICTSKDLSLKEKEFLASRVKYINKKRGIKTGKMSN